MSLHSSTLEDIKAQIKCWDYVSGAEAINAGDEHVLLDPETDKQLSVLTICIMVMRNGFTVVGKSAPVSPENFNAELGRKLAYEDCIRQLWPLMDFALRERLANTPQEAAR